MKAVLERGPGPTSLPRDVTRRPGSAVARPLGASGSSLLIVLTFRIGPHSCVISTFLVSAPPVGTWSFGFDLYLDLSAEADRG